MKNRFRTGLPIRPEIYSSASGSYGIRLDEIDENIKSIVSNINSSYPDRIAFGGYGSTNFTSTSKQPCGVSKFTSNKQREYCTQLKSLWSDKNKIVEEMKKEEQYLKDQELLQQQQQTEAAKAAVEKALAEIEAAKNKTAQEQAKAQQELAKAQAAQQLAESGRTDDAARLLGQDVKSYKGLVIGGIILGALGVGFVVYKMLAKKKVV